MKVILRKDQEKLGATGDLVEVKDGYARNCLIPKNLAYHASAGSMRALEKEPGIRDIAVFGGGLHVTVEDPTAATPRIHEILASANIDIRHLEVISPSMEDVFVARIEEEERKSS